MRKTLFAAAAASLLASVGTPALAQVDLFGSAGVGIVNFSYEDGEDSFSGIDFKGAIGAAVMFTPTLGVQGDLVLSNNTAGPDWDDITYNATAIDGALHLFYRDSSTFLLGGFVQIGSTKDTAIEGDDWTETVDRQLFGIEGQLYLDQFTLYGQAGFLHTNVRGDEYRDMSGLFASIEARYFVTDDFKIEAHAGIQRADNDTNFYALDAFNFGASAEYRLPDSPISLFAAYDYYSYTSAEEYPTSTESRFTVGAKFNFGSSSLIERDRSGASLGAVRSAQYYIGGLL
jgi:hypothetical protein